MRRFLLAFALAFATATVIAAPDADTADKAANNGFEMLHAANLKSALDQGEAIRVYDANSRETYDDGHLPGATWVESDSLTAGVLPAEKDAKLVFYCANEMCMASHFAAKQALALGYTDVHVMPEGIQGWKKAGYPVERGAATN